MLGLSSVSELEYNAWTDPKDKMNQMRNTTHWLQTNNSVELETSFPLTLHLYHDTDLTITWLIRLTEGHQCFTDGVSGHRQCYIQPTLQNDDLCILVSDSSCFKICDLKLLTIVQLMQQSKIEFHLDLDCQEPEAITATSSICQQLCYS